MIATSCVSKNKIRQFLYQYLKINLDLQTALNLAHLVGANLEVT